MKKNVFKRVISFVLTAAAVLSLCACGASGNSKETAEKNQASKQNVYAYQNLELGIDTSNVNIQGVQYMNDRLYMLVQDYSNQFAPALGAKIAVDMPVVEVMPGDGEGVVEETVEYWGPTYILMSMKLDGSDRTQVALEMAGAIDQSGYMSRMLMTDDGSIIGVQESYLEDYSDPMNPVFKTVNYLMRWDAEGKLCYKKDMVEYVGETDWYYPRDMFTLDDGSIVFFSYEGLGANVDKDGNMIAPIQMDPEAASMMGTLVKSNDGTVYMTSYNDQYTKMYISSFDIKTGVQGEKKELPGMMSNYSFYQGFSSNFLVTNNLGIYTYNVGDEAPVMIMDFINSDFPATWVNNLIPVSEDKFIASYTDQTDWQTCFAHFTKVDPKDVPDKKTIVLGCVYLDYNIRKRVIDFNKTNTQYRITIKDYNQYSTLEDYMAAYTQLNNDIISNQMPDILVVNSNIDIGNYISKGVLEDLNTFIEKDPELANVELLPNVVDAFSVDGKLYTLVPSFSVRSLIAKTSLMDGRTSWTMAEFMDWVKTLPEGTSAFSPDMMREGFIYQVMSFLGGDFVNSQTGQCSFDSQEFINILEYAKTLPKELPDNYYDDYDWTLYETMYRENRTVLMEVYISSIRDLKYSIRGQYGEPVTFIGFPTAEGNGSIIAMGSNAFAMSARSAYKDGAWEFIRYYLTDEYQNSDQFYDLPVVKSAFEKKAALAMERPYWIDESGNKIEYDDTYYINNEDIIMEPFTQEEVDEISEFIYSVNKVSRFDDELRKIILEESESFFSGSKSAQEVAKIIQSRAQIFVDENR